MRILITRPREQAIEFAELLRTIGAEPVFLPTIKISPIADTTILDRCLSRLHCYDWLILTSANAVEVVFERLAALGIKSPPKNLRIAVVGPKTATKLIQQFGSIEEIYKRIDEVLPERVRNLLKDSENAARQSKELTTIVTDVPIVFDPAACRIGHYERDKVAELFRELEFASLLPKLPQSFLEEATAVPAVPSRPN